MDGLVTRRRMLTSLAVAYGTADRFCEAHTGCAWEVEWVDGAMVPAARPVTERTLYDLASVTKLFTLIAVMQLASRGGLSLQDKVGGIVPRFRGLKDTSVAQVLIYEAALETPFRIDAQPDREAALTQVFSIRARPPEAQRLYSDMNALVLKYVVERVSGLPFYEYIERNILRPAGMVETFSLVPPERISDCASYNYEHRILGGQYRMRSDVPPGAPHDPKARLLRDGGRDLCGHAGLFSTLGDMVRLCQALLNGVLLPMDVLTKLSVHPAGQKDHPYLGQLCFVKGPEQRFSEVPSWMGDRAFAQSGFTGNHVAIDPEKGVFDLFLGNRCHNRVSVIQPEGEAARLGLAPEGDGLVRWPDGRMVPSSFLYVYQKDARLHEPVRAHMAELEWI
jgi:CubicO group peptidase (beta-lactamase class C family)